MTEEVLTHTEVLKIVYNSDKSSSDSSSDSVSSSDNEIDVIAEQMQLQMMTVVMKKKYCTEISGGGLWTITWGTEK